MIVGSRADTLRIVENWFEWASPLFRAAFPTFPSKLLTEANSGLGLPMIPLFNDGDECYFFFFLSYRT